VITFLVADLDDDPSMTVLGRALEPGDVLVTTTGRVLTVDGVAGGSDGSQTVRTVKGYGRVLPGTVYFSPCAIPLAVGVDN
jgi:hypothetical protein